MGKILTTEEFIKRAKEVHSNKYDYSKTKYKLAREKIDIICPIHGSFKQQPNHHLKGHGCEKCGHVKTSSHHTKTVQYFIKKAKRIHNNKYDYSLVEYINNKTKVKIICLKHGIFVQTPDNHYKGKGCPVCKESKGEKAIAHYLDNKNIQYIREHRFDNCKNIQALPFDFYLPEYNILIEFDGIQHFSSNFFGGENGLKYRKQNDKIKNQYCINNNIKLIRIKYNEDINLILNTLVSTNTCL